jgi:hypothetical protein
MQSLNGIRLPYHTDGLRRPGWRLQIRITPKDLGVVHGLPAELRIVDAADPGIGLFRRIQLHQARSTEGPSPLLGRPPVSPPLPGNRLERSLRWWIVRLRLKLSSASHPQILACWHKISGGITLCPRRLEGYPRGSDRLPIAAPFRAIDTSIATHECPWTQVRARQGRSDRPDSSMKTIIRPCRAAIF